MKSIQQALSSTHNAFPVLNSVGNFVGLLPKSILNTLTAKKVFYETRRVSLASRAQSAKENHKFDVAYDQCEGGFPPTPASELLDWREFLGEIDGKDVDCEDVLENVCFAYYDDLVDVRPYIWEHPFTVSIHDTLEKCLQVFVTHSLRHLCVVNPVDGSVAGLITRKDIFKWVSI